jgi:hypothetical protein
MCQLEGPIVDSIYDTALICWDKALDPPMPTQALPAGQNDILTFKEASFLALFDANGSPTYATAENELKRAEAPKEGSTPHLSLLVYLIWYGVFTERLPEHTVQDPHYDPDIASEVNRLHSVLAPLPGEKRIHAITRHLSTSSLCYLPPLFSYLFGSDTNIQPNTVGTAQECEPGDTMIPYIAHAPHEPFPIAMVSRRPYGCNVTPLAL